jgi:hypothetical protein
MASWRLLRYPRRCSYTRCGNIAPFDSFGAFGGFTALIINKTTLILRSYNRTRASGASSSKASVKCRDCH